MSLPSSERLPNDINDLPPARQRHIRRQPRAASFAEQQLLLDSLVKRTAPTPAFFLRAIIGALASGAALYLKDPTILILAVVILPFHTPLYGLALFPTTLKIKHLIKSLVSLLILVILVFTAGALAGLFQTNPSPDRLNIYRFSALYWLDLAILGVSTLLSALILLRQGQLPGGMGALLSYTLIIPIAVVGYGFTSGISQLWTGALFVSFAHFGLALVLAMLALLILGFPPKNALGWLLATVALMLTLAVMSASLNFSRNHQPITQLSSPAPTRLLISTDTPSPTTQPTPTLTATTPPATLTTTWTPNASPSHTPSITPTPTEEPTAFWGLVETEIGAVIRENPSFDSAVVGYANNADLIEILAFETPPDGSGWFLVRTASGQTGWMLGSLINTQTPAPITGD